MIYWAVVVWCCAMAVLIPLWIYEMVMTIIEERRAERNWRKMAGSSSSTVTPNSFPKDAELEQIMSDLETKVWPKPLTTKDGIKVYCLDPDAKITILGDAVHLCRGCGSADCMGECSNVDPTEDGE
jgi:hypothetical protein